MRGVEQLHATRGFSWRIPDRSENHDIRVTPARGFCGVHRCTHNCAWTEHIARVAHGHSRLGKMNARGACGECDISAIVDKDGRAERHQGSRQEHKLARWKIFFAQLHENSLAWNSVEHRRDTTDEVAIRNEAPVGHEHQPRAEHYSIRPCSGDEALA